MRLVNELWNRLLWPFSFTWENVYKLRRLSYAYGPSRQRRYQVPVISVGNLTFGGTGKTPMTLWLSELFSSKGLKTMILSRGYKGGLENSHGIIRSGKRLGFNPADFGDEALLLARRLKNACVVVGKRRADNLEFYFPKERPDVVLLEDGHQHLSIARNMNIVLFDALMPLSSYRVAPRGYLREGFSALRDAGAVVIGRVDQVSEEKLKELEDLIRPHTMPGTVFAHFRYLPTSLLDASYTKRTDVRTLKGAKVLALTGIASPTAFLSMLRDLGAEIVDTITFPDHHDYKPQDVEALLARATDYEALVVTTEKDMVKIRRISDDPRLLFLEIQLEFVMGEDKMKELIAKTTAS
jgi:tetraacyldisaccharide 4'-kinase